MKTLLSIVVCFLLVAGIAFAAGIDGKWTSERRMGENTIKIVFDLKADGAKLTGSMSMNRGDTPVKAEITDGKIDGSKFSFKVTTEGRNGKMTSTYEGTVEGDTLKGTSAREGGEPRPFEAKRQ
ncbi:MAG: hypothetical protein IPP47_09505 [Bryobacterales bacterium]|nr:hypothetical protein [Bryobacterales bacterium]